MQQTTDVQDEDVQSSDMAAFTSESRPSSGSTDSSTNTKEQVLKDLEAPDRIATNTSMNVPFSIFGRSEKRFIIFMASWAGFFSPVSANIYFPALEVLADDLGVSSSLINLTITSYMIFQGLAPAFFGSLADNLGRRPAYMICFVIYISANIGLAVQNSYAALFVLRCLQSTGSSATVALASAVVADVATPAERGRYMGFTTAGALLGPAIGPVIGGLLADFLGWRSIFWFLTIFAGLYLIIFIIFVPETARNTVGDGSIPPSGWNMSLLNYLAIRKAERMKEEGSLQRQMTRDDLPPKKKGFPDPFASLKIIKDKQTAILLIYNALLFCAFYDITATIPSQFTKIYGFNTLQLGLSYLPFGFGSLFATIFTGFVSDRNFARHAKRLGVEVRKGRNQDLRDFPIERVRLEVALPAIYISCALIIAFGWLLKIQAPLAAVFVILFLTSFTMCIAFSTTSTLIIDFYPQRPATATAANNLLRCLLGAGATGLIVPMINGMGLGWAYTFIALVLLSTSPLVWLQLRCGMIWRQERLQREGDKQAETRESKAGRLEKGQSTDDHT